MSRAFRLTDVVKTFPGFQLGPLSLELEPGTVLGYIGPNASGKTTTFHCMAGVTRPGSGTIEIFGRLADHRDPAWKLDLGYVGDIHAFYENWTAEANLAYRAKFYPAWSQDRARELAKRFDLPLDVKAKSLSTGNRVKLSLVAALAHSPRLLLLDEPTSGLDPVVRREVLDTLFEVLESGERAIFYATHILSDIGRLADRLAFLKGGKLMQISSKDDLLDKWRRISFRYTGSLPELDAGVAHETQGASHRVVSSDHTRTLGRLQALGAEGIEATRMTIDDIAVEILKGGNHVATD
jgi:ABC-2 type transport system ATP-binding protein